MYQFKAFTFYLVMFVTLRHCFDKLEKRMCKFLLMALLMVSFTMQAEEEIRGDKNHDGVLSGEEQFLRDNKPPPPEPEVKKTAPKKTVPRTMPTVGVTEIDTGYGVKGWVARSDGLQADPERLKYLQADIVHASTDDYKQRTDVSNAIVETRSQRNTITRIIEQAQRDNVDVETLLWRLKIEGYKHIMQPMMALENADKTLTELQATRNYNASLQSQQNSYATTPNSPAPVQNGQPYYYPQAAPYYNNYTPQAYYNNTPQQGQSIVQNSASLPTVRNGRIEYRTNCALPTVRNGRLECY